MESKTYKVNEYKTKDLGEAAAYLTKDVKLLRFEGDFNFFWFIFREDEVVGLTDGYWNGELLVPARIYQENLRSLKDRIFAQMKIRNPGG